MVSKGGMILDFNSDLWDVTVDGVVRHPSGIVLGEDDSGYPQPSLRKNGGLTIISSLPYRQIVPPRFHMHGEFGGVGFDSNYVMLGDDIVCPQVRISLNYLLASLD